MGTTIGKYFSFANDINPIIIHIHNTFIYLFYKQKVHAPRFPNILDYEKEYEKFVTSDDPRRPKWVSLAGRIYEWQALYDDVPKEKSWVWRYYDDGPDYYLSFYRE